MDKKNKLREILKKITKKSILDNAKTEREKSYDIRKIFEQMELDLISSMHRAFYFHQSEQIKEGFEWEQWQLTKLREMEKYRKRNKDIVDSYSKPIQQAIDRELRGNYSKGENRFLSFIDKVKQFFGWKSKSHPSIELPADISEPQTVKQYIAKELGRPGAVPQETNFFGVNDKKLEALISTVDKDLTKAQHSVLRKMDDVYRQTIFKSHMYLQNGAKTLNQAIDMATKDFLEKGINSIQYKNGANVNIASYAEMALRTANHRATLLGEGKKRDEYGIHLVVVSAHANTCPMCEPWQGKVLIDDVFSHGTKLDEDYPLLSEAITQGFLHPNCRHTVTTFFPGITKLPQKQDEKEAIRVYEAEQKQRAYEREIRKWKRKAIGSVETYNKEEAIKKVNSYNKKLAQLLKDEPSLRRSYRREEVSGYTNIKKMSSNSTNKQQINVGEKISEEELTKFANKLNELGINHHGFKEYCGEPKILEEISVDLERIIKDFPTVKNLKNGLILKYEDLGNIEDFAITQGKSIILNKRVYDDSNYMKNLYSNLADEGFFVKGTNYRSVIYHESGHIINNKNKALTRRIRDVVEEKAKLVGSDKDKYIIENISQYAVQKDWNYNYHELLSEVISACYNSNIEITRNLANEILNELGVRI